MKVWFITGVSRGLGNAIAVAALAAGDQVIGTVRKGSAAFENAGDRLHLLTVDLAKPGAAEAAARQALSVHGKIDVVVNNAGFGVIGALDDLTDDQLEVLFEVDVFAGIQICRTLLPHMRAQGAGRILNITSVAGRAPGAATAAYAAAKAAVEGFSAALAAELDGTDIHVTAIAPGQFRTDFLDNATMPEDRQVGADQGGATAKALSSLRQINQRQLGDPTRAASVIVRLAQAANPPTHLLLGTDALNRVLQQRDRMDAEMKAWEAQTRSTDFGED
ncbi:SDR family NAD(P)-dependent oxidoreductase [Maritimibacter dapengensis]|uniref:SDR family NAD(P)-dependent oxidoreductase n=1 Tax=Maritimibacter dapengensis TaxID=2836868 RepID=A0ABS6T3V0_9RHOB|nr:SDR family NAD(P)-dependent oxidoreductase [Maritimibacter dapengensis]MBV7379926.1 SDR family NAD(P)-dependent oxidoreductase [Maritimibacter dapengensis]